MIGATNVDASAAPDHNRHFEGVIGMAIDSLAKRCTKCGTEKPLDGFYRVSGSTRPRPVCKSCMNAIVKLSRATDLERWRKYGRNTYWAHQEDCIQRADKYRNSEHGKSMRAAYYEASREKRIAYRESRRHLKAGQSKAFRIRHGRRLAVKQIARKFKLPYEVAYELLQRDQCELCGVRGRRMHIDHCHETGVVRGRICGPCNQGLGMFGDDPVKLRLAIKYLLQSRAADIGDVA